MSYPDLQARVNRGAAWLDKHVPDWYTYVSLRSFDILNECKCVLGQVFKPIRNRSVLSPRLIALAKSLRRKATGYYGDDTSMGSGYEDSKEVVVSNRFATSCGFDMGDDGGSGDWDELQRLWKVEIEARKKAVR